MAHECEDCGESFETLTRLRLHDCEVTTPPAPSDAEEPLTDDRDATVPDLDDHLDRASDGDVDAILGAVATFESELSAALDEDDGGATYRDVFWAYYEPISDALDEAARSGGWPILEGILEAYDPTIDETIPLATPAIANAVGRTVIRTRLADGVEAIPAGALDYLDAVAVEAGDGDDLATEETHAYGWGIGRPDHAVVDRLHERASEDVFWVNPVLEHAFYADQHAAVDALERLVRDGDSLSVVGAASQPSDGSLTVDNGTFEYTPEDGFTGEDSFAYRVEDTAGATDIGVVTISVTEDTNEPPLARDDSATVGENATLELETAELVRGDRPEMESCRDCQTIQGLLGTNDSQASP
jgi:hypothetical protein